MATSLRKVCADCLDKTGGLRLYRDLFGYPHGRIARPLSVRQHVQRIRGPSINLCVIFVGHEPDFSGTFTPAQALSTQHAVDLMRELYAQVGLGVRRLYWHYIPQLSAWPWLTVDADGATSLTEAISSDTDGIDLFMVQMVSDAGGWSNTEGPCDKDDKGRTGAVVEVALAVTDSNDFLGIVVAHEVAHYLGLKHSATVTNLMGTDVDDNGIGDLSDASRHLTAVQGQLMHASCWVRKPC